MKKKQVKIEEPRRPSLDDTIKALLKEDPLAGVFFCAAIAMLRDRITKMSDDEVKIIFENLLHPQDVRDYLEEMYDRMNSIKI